MKRPSHITIHIPLEQLWHCQNCQRTGELDRHARCGTCGSDAVAMASPGKVDADLRELERILSFEVER